MRWPECFAGLRPFQGRRMEAVDINSHLALSADQIAGGSDVGLSAVVLSHAHIDHSGNLPSLTHAARPRAGATALLAGGCRAGKSSVPTSNAV